MAKEKEIQTKTNGVTEDNKAKQDVKDTKPVIPYFNYSSLGYGGYAKSIEVPPGETTADLGFHAGTRAWDRRLTTAIDSNDRVAYYLKKFQDEHCAIFKSYDDVMKAIDENSPDLRDDNYFPIRNGWMCVHVREINSNRIIAVNDVKECPIATVPDRSLDFKIKNKIPKELLIEIIGSFHRICDKTRDEAAAQIYRKADGSYFIYYPGQEISGSYVTYTYDQGMLNNRAESLLVLELHSHNQMNAFWSDTDDRNEMEIGFYMVIGRLNQDMAVYKLRLKFNDLWINFRAHEIFDMTEEEEKEIFSKKNFSEGNPIIDSKVRPYLATARNYNNSVSSRYNYLDRRYWGLDDSEYYSGLYGGTTRYSKSNPTYPTDRLDILEKLKKMKAGTPPKFFERSAITKSFGDIGPSGSYMSKTLWSYYQFDSDLQVPVYAGYIYLNPNWYSIDYLLAKTEDRLKTETNTYVQTLEKRYDKDGMQKAINSGTDTHEAAYLLGRNNLDMRPSFCGEIDRPITTHIARSENVNDTAIQSAVASQTAARFAAANNIAETVLKASGANSKETLDVFKLSIFWEIITPYEKALIADTLGVSVVELASDMAKAIAEGYEMPVEATTLIYEMLLCPEDDRTLLADDLVEVLPAYLDQEQNIVKAFCTWAKNGDMKGDRK